MIVSYQNLLAGLSPLVAPAAAAGYRAKDLADGTVGRGWRAAASATSFTLDWDFGANVQIHTWAAFDVRGAVGLAPQVGFQYRSTTGGAWVDFGSSPALLRDGARHRMFTVGAAVSARQVRFVFTLGASAALYLGELWAGPAVLLSRNYTGRRDQILHSTVTHETPAGVVTARKTGPDRRRLGLSFEKWLPNEQAEMELIYGATSGLWKPIALDLEDGSAPYHGRLANNPSWETDYPLTDRHEWTFTESGRAL